MIKPHSVDRIGHGPAVYDTRDSEICTSHAIAADQCYITSVSKKQLKYNIKNVPADSNNNEEGVYGGLHCCLPLSQGEHSRDEGCGLSWRLYNY